MKQKKLRKKWVWFGCLVFFTMQPNYNYAQSVKRQTISSYGSVVLTDNLIVGQTAGQSYSTKGCIENSTTLLQGFQQPNTFIVEEINAPSLKNLNLSVYPNPASYSITITGDEMIEQPSIYVQDINGKVIFSENAPDLLMHTINCDSWENGIYLITITDSNKNSKTLRLIISK